MGLLNTFKSVLDGGIGNVESSLASRFLSSENLQPILQKLQASGFGDQVQSWISGQQTRLPITAEQLRTALGNAHIQQIAQKLGLPVDTMLATLTRVLPQVAAQSAPAQPSPAAEQPVGSQISTQI